MAKPKKKRADVCASLDKHESGFYLPISYSSKDIKWEVKIGEGHFVCDKQVEAQILSMLAKICTKLKIKV